MKGRLDMKKIKLPLEVANGVQARNLDELKNNWDMEKILLYFTNGRLSSWLQDRYYTELAAQVASVDDEDSRIIQRKLCKIFGVEYDEHIIDIDLLNEKNRRLEIVKAYTCDERVLKNISCVAFDQEELAELLDAGEELIFLCNNTFSIPLTVTDKHYVGIGDVIVEISSKTVIDFDELGIKFDNIKFGENYSRILANSPEVIFNKGLYAEERKDFAEALQCYKRVADMGFANGLFKVGYFYQMGLGCEVDYDKAMDAYKKAADCNYPGALNNIGSMYEFAEGVAEDCTEALKWYSKAAEYDFVVAYQNIGNLYYYEKINDSARYEKALQFFRKAEGLGLSAYMLGRMYELGQGTEKDIDQAQRYYRKACESGYYDRNFMHDATYKLAFNQFSKFNDSNGAREIIKEFYDKEKIQVLLNEIGKTFENNNIGTYSPDLCPVWNASSVTRDEFENRAIKAISDQMDWLFRTGISRYNAGVIEKLREMCEQLNFVKKVLEVRGDVDSDKIANDFIKKMNDLQSNVWIPSAYDIYNYLDLDFNEQYKEHFWDTTTYVVMVNNTNATRFVANTFSEYCSEIKSIYKKIQGAAITEINNMKLAIK